MKIVHFNGGTCTCLCETCKFGVEKKISKKSTYDVITYIQLRNTFAGLDMELEEYKPSHVAGNKLQ